MANRGQPGQSKQIEPQTGSRDDLIRQANEELYVTPFQLHEVDWVRLESRASLPWWWQLLAGAFIYQTIRILTAYLGPTSSWNWAELVIWGLLITALVASWLTKTSVKDRSTEVRQRINNHFETESKRRGGE